MSTRLSKILTFYITLFYLLKTQIYYRCISKKFFWELASLLHRWYYSVKFPNFSKQPLYKTPGDIFFCIVSIIKLLLIKLLLVISMVKKWEICQVKSIDLCFSKYCCSLWNLFWWNSQVNYVINSYINWWKIINFYLGIYFHEKCFNKSKLFHNLRFLPYS